jgi:hypothetical protein
MSNVPDLKAGDEVVQAILAPRSKEALVNLVNHARASEGRAIGIVAWDDGDELCPRYKFPFPPRPKFQDFLNGLMLEGHAYRVFPIGIPFPEELIVDVRTRAHQV